jgi:uncharacterized Fe-S cluster-containing radical SAM superfamily protein
MYDPIELSNNIERLVCKSYKKKYYRFRPTRFYGGIATADTVGCNLRCKFCWSTNSVWKSKTTGEFYSAEAVADKLLNIAESKGFHQVRISGGEPTIGKKHLFRLLDNIYPNLIFILETNGILLGLDNTYITDLSKFKNLHVRVCIKGVDSKEFSFITGAKKGFEYQMKSIEYLNDSKINFNIALVSIIGNRQDLYYKLKEMGLGNIMVEEEEIKLYPNVRNRLEKEGLLKYF